MAELGDDDFNLNISSGSVCQISPGAARLGCWPGVSLLAGREDTQRPAHVSCQEFSQMCQTTLMIFAGV